MEPIVDYVSYVEEQITKFQSITRLHRDANITPELINTALAEYENVNIALIGEYNRAKIDEYETKKQFEMWYNKTFSEVRQKMIKELGEKSIKIAVKEYEAEMKLRYETEYWTWQDKIVSTENKTSFILRLVEAWKSYDKILVTLSSNMRGEMYALSLDNRINQTQDRVRVLPQRSKKLED